MLEGQYCRLLTIDNLQKDRRRVTCSVMNQPASLALLKTHSLPSLVQEELERMILDGRLVPGEPLREAALAASLGVSRGPVREAFRALEEKGLVLVEKNHGVQVRTLSLEEADEIYEVRICLEELIGQKAAASADVAGRRELKAVLAQMEKASTLDDVNPYTSLNLAFHDALARLTGNAKLHATYLSSPGRS